jgi:hypothetical protein
MLSSILDKSVAGFGRYAVTDRIAAQIDYREAGYGYRVKDEAVRPLTRKVKTRGNGSTFISNGILAAVSAERT